MNKTPTKKHRYDVAIIIVNYNSSEYTIQCIERVLEKSKSPLSLQIIIVDNASEEKDFTFLQNFIFKLNSEKVILHRSRINTGFGGGNMYGVQQANAEYYLFLNNDTLLMNDAVSYCHDFMEKTEDAAVCGAQIYNEYHKKEVSFDHFTSFAREVFGKKAIESLLSKPDRRKTYTNPIAVDYVNGSFMFFRASDFNAVGGFDTNIFLYFEESDICHRLRKNGRYTYFLPTPSYLHYQGKSIDKTGIPIATKIELKTSMFYVIRKNYGYLHYQLLRLFFVFRYGLTTLIKPKYAPLFHRILIGLPLGKSLKQKQQIRD
ncbi:glycosyltransferase family 2 protein [Flavobacteriaceae bacterium TP-CH-4]|uniref:Glycosyltransferase family 2 protein n=1 Tax=Pelagihabitans pacificus TaxID=2696054 RepID=A0A967AY60_9FLAO|nr:glycosyltransferase family 2 protein [Pelagihabitans pacificus]NHF61285.1 glycosyltransferase family 2 protein [Pelagihabitans pacificus]